MNKIIKEQLNKCRVAVIPEFGDVTTHICIKKVNEILPTNMKSNHIYLIKVKPSVKVNTTIASNWNGGKLPKYDYYKVERVGDVGNMVKLNGIAYDNGDLCTEPFYGYLPYDGFEIIEEVG